MKQIIDQFIPKCGKHCITGALQQIFDYYGYPLSEEMLFGLGEGLDFTYINLAASPLVSGRSKTVEFEYVLADRLDIDIRLKQPKSYDMAFKATKRLIDAGHPVFAYVDMPYLPYLGLAESSHFGGHAIVIFGYDDEQQQFYISDRDSIDFPINTPNGPSQKDYHLVSYAQMEVAHGSRHRPFPANNKYAEFQFDNYSGIDRMKLTSAIQNVCDKMLSPPAKLKGSNGILKFSSEIKKWKKFDNQKLSTAATTNYFQINRDGGTGGGIFRSMYGQFLIEASDIMNNPQVSQIGTEYLSLAENWDVLAEELWQLTKTCNRNILDQLSNDIFDLYTREKGLLEKLAAVTVL